MSNPSSDQGRPGTEPVSHTLFLSLVAAIGGFLFGFDSGVINGTVDALQRAFDSDTAGTGFNVASMLLGCAVGAFFAGTLADRFGRKPILLATAVAFMISSWGSGAAGGSAEFVFFRIMGGLAVGAASILAPAYISEIAPARIRGALASLQQLMIVLGLFCAFLSNYLLANASGGASNPFWWGFETWQWMYWMELFPATIFLLGLLYIPESPRYLVAANRLEQARSVLAWLNPVRDPQAKVDEIRSTLTEGERPRIADIINRATRRLHPIVWVGLGLAVLQQLTGINVIFYYGATLWQAAGFTEAQALWTNVITGFTNIVFTLVAIALVDRIGRRPLLLIGSLGMMAALACLAVIFHLAPLDADGQPHLEGTRGLLALISANLYVVFFAFSWGPIMWVMLGEMFPNRFRGSALAFCGMAQWGANFLVTMTFPILLAWVGLGFSYSLYAAMGLVSFFFVWRFVAETKGKTLEQMTEGAITHR